MKLTKSPQPMYHLEMSSGEFETFQRLFSQNVSIPAVLLQGRCGETLAEYFRDAADIFNKTVGDTQR